MTWLPFSVCVLGFISLDVSVCVFRVVRKVSSLILCVCCFQRLGAKKKQWVDNLEKKAKDMESVNGSLQQEVAMLRSEVEQLKSILIAHKDCPLTVHHTKGTSPEVMEDRKGDVIG